MIEQGARENPPTISLSLNDYSFTPQPSLVRVVDCIP